MDRKLFVLGGLATLVGGAAVIARPDTALAVADPGPVNAQVLQSYYNALPYMKNVYVSTFYWGYYGPGTAPTFRGVKVVSKRIPGNQQFLYAETVDQAYYIYNQMIYYNNIFA